MKGPTWKTIESVFTQAIQINNHAKRALYIEKACRNQMALRSEVESLLAAYEKTGDFLGFYSSVGGTVLSHYDVLERIGEGGMGHVYKARDRRLDRLVAIKVLPSWDMGDPQARKRLVREAGYASALNHPNIVAVYEIGRAKKMDFLVMEYVPGRGLDRLIPQRGMPVAKAIPLALQVAGALSTAHGTGILHRDLKPQNIIVTKAGHAKLLDFGLAQQLGEKPAEPRFGTRTYMAPEQKSGITDARSEIFSFGLVLYELLCGRRPFPDARNKKGRGDRTDHLRPLRPKIPAPLAAIVRRCLERNPEQRFQSMTEVLRALETFFGNQQPGFPPSVLTPQPPSENLRRVRMALERIGFQSFNDSRRAFEEIVPLLSKDSSPYMRQVVASAMRTLILTVTDDNYYPVPPSIREVRRLAMELVRVATRGDFLRCFKDNDLERVDLCGMNFEGAEMTGLSFRQSFLGTSNFRGSCLVRVSFAGAFIRNANLENADLSGADFTHADWFNAVGLTSDQLAAVRRDTLLDCPPTVESLHDYLKGRYLLPFETWARPQREQLQAAWAEYLRPGGLRDVIAVWRRVAS